MHRGDRTKGQTREEEATEKEEAWKDRFLREEARDRKRNFVINSSWKKRQGVIKMQLIEGNASLTKNLSKASVSNRKKMKEKEDH